MPTTTKIEEEQQQAAALSTPRRQYRTVFTPSFATAATKEKRERFHRHLTIRSRTPFLPLDLALPFLFLLLLLLLLFREIVVLRYSLSEAVRRRDVVRDIERTMDEYEQRE